MIVVFNIVGLLVFTLGSCLRLTILVWYEVCGWCDCGVGIGLRFVMLVIC